MGRTSSGGKVITRELPELCLQLAVSEEGEEKGKEVIDKVAL